MLTQIWVIDGCVILVFVHHYFIENHIFTTNYLFFFIILEVVAILIVIKTDESSLIRFRIAFILTWCESFYIFLAP